MTRWLYCYGVVWVSLLCVWLRAQERSASEFPVLDFCELVRAPDAYLGKDIAVRGTVAAGWLAKGKSLKEFAIGQPSSSLACPGTRIEVIVPDLQRQESDRAADESSVKDFEGALRQRTHVEAVFQGRVDIASSKPRQRAVRLTLFRVSELIVRKVAQID
jgi:hypothetical protein